jgi:hypothetical protein
LRVKGYFARNTGHKIWGVLPIIVRGMYRVGSFFDKSAHLFVDLPATKTILAAFRQIYPARLLIIKRYA